MPNDGHTSLEAISSNLAPAPAGTYSQAVSAGDLVFVSGLGPLDPSDGTVQGTTITEQTELVLDHLETLLGQAGVTIGQVAKLTVHLANLHKDFSDYDRVLRRRLLEPLPARTTVGSTLASGFLVEIDAVAHR